MFLMCDDNLGLPLKFGLLHSIMIIGMILILLAQGFPTINFDGYKATGSQVLLIKSKFPNHIVKERLG